jgi:hypothetical protein
MSASDASEIFQTAKVTPAFFVAISTMKPGSYGPGQVLPFACSFHIASAEKAKDKT